VLECVGVDEWLGLVGCVGVDECGLLTEWDGLEAWDADVGAAFGVVEAE
jgi:hypothetical protein